MSLHEDLTLDLRQEIDALGGSIPLSPTTIALAVQRKYVVDGIEPHLEYASLEHIKQLARKELARRYEPDGEANVAHQGDMFSGLLQDAYPLPAKEGVDPIYKPREQLNEDEWRFNLSHLRKSAMARLAHADALQAWGEGRFQKAA